jgi:hypothetical protein
LLRPVADTPVVQCQVFTTILSVDLSARPSQRLQLPSKEETAVLLKFHKTCNI